MAPCGVKLRKWDKASFVCKGVMGAEVWKVVCPLCHSSSDTFFPWILPWLCECSYVMVVCKQMVVVWSQVIGVIPDVCFGVYRGCLLGGGS